MMPRGFGLRARVIAAFGIGALLLSLLLSAVVYSLTRGNLLEQRVDDVLKNAVVNAQGLNAELGRLGPSNVGEPAEIRAERIALLNQFVVPVGAYQGLRINADIPVAQLMPIKFAAKYMRAWLVPKYTCKT